MAEKHILGPDPRKSFTYQELPIGSTITGIEPDTAHTGTWRFYRPVFTPSIAPCHEACPAGVDVRGFIATMKKNRFEEAFLHFMEENPFPGLCAKMCSHPCEDACNRKNIDTALSVRALEEEISKLHVAVKPISDPEREIRKIAITGASIAGLSCAYFLARLGYRPVVFQGDGLEVALRENSHYHNVREVIDREVRVIVDSGVTMESGRWVWEDLSKFDAVFLTTGSSANKPSAGWKLRTRGNKILVNPVGETDRKGVFAGGEAVSDRQNIVEAIRDGKRAAMGINASLSRRDPLSEREGFVVGEKDGFAFHDYRVRPPNQDRLSRVVHFCDLNPSILPVKPLQKTSGHTSGSAAKRPENGRLTRSREKAIEEASRCLECGTCSSCGRCLLYCPEGAISRSSTSLGTIEVDYAFCKGCGICRNECPRGMFILKREESEWE